jgi:hypothetical protein
MAGDSLLDSSPNRSRPNNPPNLRRIQRPTFAGTEDRMLVGGTLPYRVDRVPNRKRKQDGPGLAALAEDRDLPSILSFGTIFPPQTAQLADPNPASVETEQKGAVSGLEFEGEHPLDLRLRQDPLVQRITKGSQANRTRHIVWQIANAMPEGEQGLHGSHLPILSRRCQPLGFDPVGESLDIAKGDAGKGLGDEGEERRRICPIRPLRVDTPPMEPERDEMGVVVGLARKNWLVTTGDDGQVVGHGFTPMQDKMTSLA